MSSSTAYLVESLKSASTMKGLGISVEELKRSYLQLMESIVLDRRNYMSTIIGDQKEHIITSKLSDMIELVNPEEYANGTSFKLIGNKVSIAASRVISSSENASVWTLDKILAEMSQDFIPIEKDLISPVVEGYAGTTNLVSVENITRLHSHDVLKRDSPKISVSSMHLMTQTTSEKGIVTANHFLDNFITKNGISESSKILATFGPRYDKIKFNSCAIEEIVLDISDGDLSGEGSKLGQYIPLSAASSLSPSEVTIDFIFTHSHTDEGEYILRVGDDEYSYLAAEGDTPDMIAMEMESLLGDDTGVTVSNVSGVYSVVYENTNMIKSLGIWNNDITEDQAYEIYIEENPSGEGPVGYTTEDTNGDGTACTVYLPLDDAGETDLDNSTLQGLVDAINDASFWDGGALVMPGEDPFEPYDSEAGAIIELMQMTSRLNIQIQDDRLIETETTISSQRYDYLVVMGVISTYSEAKSQSGTVEIVAINPGASMAITIDSTPSVLDLSLSENEDIVSVLMATTRLMAIIEESGTSIAISQEDNVLFFSATPGTVFSVSTSGESEDYAVALERDTMLKHDMQHHLSIHEKSIPPLKIADGVPTSDRSVLGRKTLEKMVDNGYIFSPKAIMWPNIEYTFSQENVTTQQNLKNTIDKTISKYESGFESKGTQFISKSSPFLSRPMFVPLRSKSDRWYFLEAKPTVIASKKSVDIVLNTLTPSIFEKEVLMDEDQNFTTILSDSTPSGFFEAESISSLLNEKAKGKPKCDFNLYVNRQMEVFTTDVSDTENSIFYVSEGSFEPIEIIDGFMLRSTLPDDLKNNISIDGFNYLFKIALFSTDELREQRFVELASMLVLSSDQLGSNIYIPQAATYVFGTDATPISPSISNGIDGIPVNGTLTMDRLYFRNFRDVVLSNEGEHVSTVSSGKDKGVATLLLRAFDIQPIMTPSARAVYDDEFFSESYASVLLSDSNNILMEELIRTGYFPGDVSSYIKNIGNGMSEKYNDSILNTLMEAIQINDMAEIISVGSAKTLMHEIYINKKDVFPLDGIDLALMMMPYDAYIGRSDVNIASGLFNLCMKIFLYLKRTSIAVFNWEDSFKDIQILIFDETDDTIDTIPFLAFELFLLKIGFLTENRGENTIDAMIEDIETSLESLIPSISDKSIYHSDGGKGLSIDGKNGLAFVPVDQMTYEDTLSRYTLASGEEVTVSESDVRALILDSQFVDRSAVFIEARVKEQTWSATVTEASGVYTLSPSNNIDSTASVVFEYLDKFNAITLIEITGRRYN